MNALVYTLIRSFGVSCCIFLFSSCTYHYIALGASDTLGVGAQSPDDAYPHLVSHYLNTACRTTSLSIAGTSGATVDEALKNQLNQAVERDADIVSIWIGANDIVKGIAPFHFQTSLRKVVLTLTRDRRRHIFIATIPALHELPRFKKKIDSDVTRSRVDQFNEIIRKFSAHEHIHVVDLSAIKLSEELLSEDGFHPSSSGYRRIAEEFISVMNTVLCSNPSMDPIPVS